jgi:spore maturation protein CgeB
MRVLFASLRWDYKDPARGDSFEFVNLWGALERTVGVEASFWGIDDAERRLGRDGANAALIERVREIEPDLVFFLLFKDEIAPETVRTLGRLPGVTTLNWFADDHWRFQSFSRHWAPLFDVVATTDLRAPERYRRLGLKRVVLTQWGCNQHLYRPTGVPLDLDVCFVGQPYGARRASVERLRAAGIRVETWGEGWDTGRLPQERLSDTFSRTRINLNFTDSSQQLEPATIARQFIRRYGPIPGPRFGSLRSSLQFVRDTRRPQIKARIFEIAASGGFVLTQHADGIERYLEPGSEIATFRTPRDLVDQVERWLADDAARTAVAAAGYRRTLEEHTYEHRFREIFAKVDVVTS